MRSCPTCSQLQSDSLGFCPQDGAALGAPDPQLGQTLAGQFRLEARIGEGGCGDVYRAHQAGVERKVAVKFLHPNAARQPEFASRFAREARAAARLSHPNIVTVFQLGESAEGLPYIAMEWADASPIGRGPETLSHGDILLAAKQIASALCEAHEAGIIHRDLKPGNVLLGRRGGSLHVTLVDFGIAKILDSELMRSGETHLTRAGVVYGTPQYLSPEQAGDQALDARADLYSLGVILYELFAGQLPFESMGMALLVDHLTTKPRHLATMVPDLDSRVSDLVMQLLEKDPEHRPASARELLGTLRGLSEAPAHTQAVALPSQRRSGGARLGIMVALLLWLASSGSLGAANMQTEGQAPAIAMASEGHEPALAEPELNVDVEESEPVREAKPSVPQRALLVSASGYSVRVLVPQYLGANAEHEMAVELWDSGGAPVRSDALVVVFTDESGQEQGVSVPASSTPGRYELHRSFERAGTHAMHVLPETPGVSLRLHFDVEPEAEPNT